MIKNLRRRFARVPVLGPLLRTAYRHVVGRPAVTFRRSDQYWEDRYRMGGTSGSGSYGRLAQFKADFLNEFIERKKISSVAEFGCGDGAQLELAAYPRYIGFDVAATSIDMCAKRFADNPNYEFHLVGSERFNTLKPVDLAISLDVIFHLVEDEVFDAYMRKLFSSARRYVVIYAYDFDQRLESRHERGREFTRWIERNAPEWTLVQRRSNPYPYDPVDPDNTSKSDFFVFAYRGSV